MFSLKVFSYRVCVMIQTRCCEYASSTSSSRVSMKEIPKYGSTELSKAL